MVRGVTNGDYEQMYAYIRTTMAALGRDAATSLRVLYMETMMHNAETAHGVSWFLPDPTCPCAIQGRPNPICVSAGRTAYCTCAPGTFVGDPHQSARAAYLFSTWPCRCREISGTLMVLPSAGSVQGTAPMYSSPSTTAPLTNVTQPQPTKGVSAARLEELKRIGLNPRSRYFLERLKAEN